MVRKRLTIMALAAGLGLAAGCATCSDQPWFGRLRGRPVPTSADGVVYDGPVLGNCGPEVVPPCTTTPMPAAPIPGPTPLTPEQPIPQLVQPPAARLTPTPQPQAPVQAYTPGQMQRRTRTELIGP